MTAGCEYARSHHEKNYDYCVLTNKKLPDGDKCDFGYDECQIYCKAQKKSDKQKETK